jgi:AmmeMemoRadiSam system protein B
VAAYGFSYLKYSSFDGFVVIAPSHRARFNGASILPEGSYSTPLGEMEVDSEMGNELIKSPLFNYIREIDELKFTGGPDPFYPVYETGLKLVPIVIGSTDISVCRKAGEAIAGALKKLDRNYAIIISTDLSHYYPYKKAVQMDGDFISALKSFDETRIAEAVNSGKGEACGEGALLAGITAVKLLGASRIEIAKYANSGDTAGSKEEVVGYVSAVILGEE